jgi:two-component system, LytTR family, sensor kinase
MGWWRERQLVTESLSNTHEELRLRPALVAAIWTVPALLSCAQRFLFSAMGATSLPLWRLVLSQAPPWYAWAALTPFIRWITRRFPLRPPYQWPAIVAHIAACLASQVIHGAVYTTSLILVQTTPPQFTPLGYLLRITLGDIPAMTLVYAAVVGVIEWRGADMRARSHEVHASALSAELARAQLVALQMQLQPHFLFNALNTISVFIGEGDRERAMRLVARLGDVLRTVLRADAASETSLRAEIAFIAEYLDIEQERFSDRLELRWELDAAALDLRVPVFVLQPLVENALRHGVGRAPAGGTLEIGARAAGRRLILWVRDDGPGDALATDVGASEPGLGIGLVNTRARLTRLYGSNASLTLDRDRARGIIVEITLPVRPVNEDALGPRTSERASVHA